MDQGLERHSLHRNWHPGEQAMNAMDRAAADLIRAVERAAWVTIDVLTDGEGWWLARAMVDGEETATGYTTRTIENASGDSKLSAVCKLAMKLQPRSTANLDALIEAARAPLEAPGKSIPEYPELEMV